MCGILFAGLLLIPVSCATTKTAEPASAAPSRPILKVGHRGAAGLMPENTLVSFRKGLECGADIIELDVHLSSDGELVVMHDPKVERTTDGSGELGTKTFAEIRKLNAAAKFTKAAVEPQQVPTLQEALDVLKPSGCEIHIEIKLRSDGTRYAGIEKKVLDLVRGNDLLEKAVITSFDQPTLKELKVLEPKVRTLISVNKSYFQAAGMRGPESIADELSKLGLEYVAIDQGWLLPAYVKALHAKGLRVGVWTVDDEGTIRRFISMDVDFITSNRPDLLLKVLGPTPK